MDKKRWGIEDEPNWERFFKKRDVTHPVINSWDELGETDKEMLLYVKNVITSYIGECIVCLGGSRIKGYWNEDSDYDIKIYKLPEIEQLRSITSYPWKHKLDISFCSSEHYGIDRCIEIKTNN